MATVQVSLAEYLAASYRPDCDYIYGELEERHVGEKEHSAVQAFFVLWLGLHEKEWKLEAFPELRIQVATDRVRVADIAVLRQDEPYESVLTRPPLAIVEVLSPEDRISRYQDRLEDYRRMGIPAIWVIDPGHRGAFNCSGGVWVPAEEFRIRDTDVRIPMTQLWSKLDALRGR
ncbi:MAG: Uma2 family endonuclease [Terriglobales bacterium]|jgi:Uma2 family endonuclease